MVVEGGGGGTGLQGQGLSENRSRSRRKVKPRGTCQRLPWPRPYTHRWPTQWPGRREISNWILSQLGGINQQRINSPGVLMFLQLVDRAFAMCHSENRRGKCSRWTEIRKGRNKRRQRLSWRGTRILSGSSRIPQSPFSPQLPTPPPLVVRPPKIQCTKPATRLPSDPLSVCSNFR